MLGRLAAPAVCKALWVHDLRRTFCKQKNPLRTSAVRQSLPSISDKICNYSILLNKCEPYGHKTKARQSSRHRVVPPMSQSSYVYTLQDLGELYACLKAEEPQSTKMEINQPTPIWAGYRLTLFHIVTPSSFHGSLFC